MNQKTLPPNAIWVALLTGIPVGLLAGLIGLGGGEFRLPFLVLLFGIVAKAAVPLNLIISLTPLIHGRAWVQSWPISVLRGTRVATDLSSVTLDRFSQTVENLLKAWHFPEAQRVHFDTSTRGLVIAGKRRGSRGKGMRAITHAAFTLGLMDYCRQNTKPHPGFAVLDSPLLAYRPPDADAHEADDDELRGTDLHAKFYDVLRAHPGSLDSR